MAGALSADLFAHTRPEQVSVTVDGHVFVLTATTAYQWLGAIGYDLDDLTGVLPGLIADSDIDVMLAVSEPRRRCLNAARVAVGRAGGRDWWWVWNLAKRCLGGWPYINGTLLRQGVDPRTTAFPDWLDAAYMLLWERGDDEARTRLDSELQAAPSGVAVKADPVAVRASLEAFAAD